MATAGQGLAAHSAVYTVPVPVIDPGVHTARIWGAAVDAEARWAVTGSDDKTVRVWSLTDGALQRTIRMAAGPGRLGQVYAVAISPDGALIAAAGWTELDAEGQRQIHLIERESGRIVHRIGGLPAYAIVLAFSPDGERLAATLDAAWGLRIYGRSQGWAEVGRDAKYRQPSYGAAFAPDGRLATTSVDGIVRLYAKELAGECTPVSVVGSPGGPSPAGIAFSPDGTRIAVGYSDVVAVDVLDGQTLARLAGPELGGLGSGDLSCVAWSRDGKTLLAAGAYGPEGSRPVVAWSDAGAGTRREMLAGQDTVMGLVVLPENDLLVVAADPWLGRLDGEGKPRWVHGSTKADFRDQEKQFCVASDGAKIGFGFEQGGLAPTQFDLCQCALVAGSDGGAGLVAAKQDGLAITFWKNTNRPMLDGRPLPLEARELSRSMAVHPAGDRFVLGSEWWLRGFDAAGKQLWAWRAQADIWAVNISGDGRLVVAACGDGCVRWHRMEDGAELLALMPLADQANWVAWTPEGFFAATSSARRMLRWHVNRSIDEAADSVAIEEIKGSFRPAMLPFVLQELETPKALGMAALAEHKLQVTIRTNSRLPQDARLYLLTIGISSYNEERAGNLRLQFAERDATELARALLTSQDSLYADVLPQVLANADASRESINQGLETIRTTMKEGRGDLAVVHFSGHGAMVDGRLYLLPYDVDARNTFGIRNSGLWIEDLKVTLLDLAKLGLVLVLLDACHAGGMTMDGARISMDSAQLRLGLAAANVMVLSSCKETEDSQERPEWQHGAFTKAVIEALTGADTDHDGLIGPTELAEYVDNRVRWLTDGAQTPGMEVRFNNTLFAARM